jgi:signal transduction histidine kinase
VLLTIFMLRTLRVFELEERRRLEEANQARLAVQAAALETERQMREQMTVINDELRLATHRLSLLVDISNILNTYNTWPQPLLKVLAQIVDTLAFAHAGLVLLTERDSPNIHVAATFGLEPDGDVAGEPIGASELEAVALGEKSIREGIGICRHVDGQFIRFTLEEAMQRRECRHYESPTLIIALPLRADDYIIGSLVLVNRLANPFPLSATDLSLMVGIAQQLGLSVENALLHRQARSREKMLAELLQAVVDAQESERQRIARELHDATGQSLTAIALGLRGVETQLAYPMREHEITRIQAQLVELQSFSSGALQELRRVIADLRPSQLDELGLAAAIRWYTQSSQRQGGAACRLRFQGDEENLSAGYKTLLFRIAQEALVNIAKHADAAEITVTLDMEPSEVRLVVEDDGRGFDVAQVEEGSRSGWGLAGIRERTLLLGGTCLIESTPGRGTRVTICAPISSAE